MNKRSVRQKSQKNKENAAGLRKGEKPQRKNNQKVLKKSFKSIHLSSSSYPSFIHPSFSPTPPPQSTHSHIRWRLFQTSFYLIVEAAASFSEDTDRSQYWFISSKDIVDVPVINSETVYTGKQIQFQGPVDTGKVCHGTVVLFSSDFSFVETQFRQITSAMDNNNSENAPPSNIMVLNNSTKGNILTIQGQNGKPRNVKVPSVISIKTIKTQPTKKESSENVDYLQLGDPDSENRPPGVIHFPDGMMDMGTGTGRVMTFDQQSQTDAKMYEIPATATQMHQQSAQMAQLIRANNGLVVQVRQLQESQKEMKEMMAQALALLNSQHTAAAIPQPPVTGGHFSEVSMSDIIEEQCESSSVDQYSISFPPPSSREVSVARSTKSENTPPLKKNKAKLDHSLRMQAAQEQLNQSMSFTEGDYQVLGVNGTMIHKTILQGLNFENPSAVTRKILVGVFDRETLASHSLTGKPSPGG